LWPPGVVIAVTSNVRSGGGTSCAPAPLAPDPRAGYSFSMCRNIRTLANFAPPATDAEIRASSLQFVRKLSGANKPSKANEKLFHRAVDEVAAAAERLVHGWVTSAPPKDRDVEIQKMIERSRSRFGKEPRRTPIDPIR
jgi:hypothetical protein